VATVVATPNDNTTQVSTYPPTDPVPSNLQPNHYHLHIQRAIAENHRSMANDSDSDTDLPPPLIPDSDMDDYDTEDTDFISRIIRPDENTSLAAAQTIDTPPLCPPYAFPRTTN
jgi:hypothetical protein